MSNLCTRNYSKWQKIIIWVFNWSKNHYEFINKFVICASDKGTGVFVVQTMGACDNYFVHA